MILYTKHLHNAAYASTNDRVKCCILIKIIAAVFSVCLLALLRAVPGVSVPEHHHELGHPHHGAVGGAQHRARAQQRPAAERVETGDAEMT